MTISKKGFVFTPVFEKWVTWLKFKPDKAMNPIHCNSVELGVCKVFLIVNNNQKIFQFIPINTRWEIKCKK